MSTTASPRRAVFVGLLAMDLAAGFWFASQSYFDRRLKDLSAIRDALSAYRQVKGAYPVSAAVSVNDESHPNPKYWIPGLAPEFLPSVPRDPRKLDAANRQYLYISDGSDYKLVTNCAEDAGWVAKRRPELVDRRRPACGYGFWSRGASEW